MPRSFQQLRQVSLTEHELPDEAKLTATAVLNLAFQTDTAKREVESAFVTAGVPMSASIASYWESFPYHIRQNIMMAFFKSSLANLKEWTVTGVDPQGLSQSWPGLKSEIAASRLAYSLHEQRYQSLVVECDEFPLKAEDMVDTSGGEDTEEDAPANAAGFGGVAGIGVGPKGEPAGRLPNRKYARGTNPYDPTMGMVRRAPETDQNIHEEAGPEFDAYEMGQRAFSLGKMRIPALDVPFTQTLGGRDRKDVIARLNAWTRGWDDANLAAPVNEEVEVPQDPAPKNPFADIFAKFKFTVIDQKWTANPLVSDRRDADHFVIKYAHPSGSTAQVWIYKVRGRDGDKMWFVRYKQPNGIMAPTSGYTKPSLANYLAGPDFGSFLSEDVGQMAEHIIQADGGYRLVSHTGKNLGTYGSKGGAEKREREVEYFKHQDEGIDTNLNPNVSLDSQTFAGANVFEIDSDKYHQCRMGKNRYHRYESYVGNDAVGEAIRAFGRKNRGVPIIVKNKDTGAMMFLRYGRKRVGDWHKFNPHQS